MRKELVPHVNVAKLSNNLRYCLMQLFSSKPSNDWRNSTSINLSVSSFPWKRFWAPVPWLRSSRPDLHPTRSLGSDGTDVSGEAV